MCRHMRTAAAGEPRSIGTATGAVAACRQASRNYMYALWGLLRQSGRRRRGARVLSIGRMHPDKCVV
jgi:hypothetical protein